MDFKAFRDKVVSKFESMVALDTLLVTKVEPDTLWETYLRSYPAGSNPVFRVRTRADCASCRSFIKKLGSAVVVQGDELVSIWDIPDLASPYKEVIRREHGS